MTKESEDLKRLERSATDSARPRTPVDKGHFQIRIDSDGGWRHQGSPFTRLALAKLFATVLKRDADGVYWLETPVERGRIDVEDAPFVAVELQVDGAGESQRIKFRDNLENWTPLDDDHPLRIVIDPETEEPRPYIKVRDRLEARLLRPVFYELVDLAEERDDDLLAVWSHGRLHELGRTGET